MRLNEVMSVIDNNYDVFQDAKYSIHPKYPNFICKYMTVGKILSFAMDQNLEKSETLQLFCEGYRDVIATPIIEWDTIIDENLYQVEDANIGIQLFNKHGFDKLRFYKNPLRRKQEYNESVIGKLLSWAKSKEIQTPLMYPLLVGYGNMGKKIGEFLSSKGFNFSCVDPIYGFKSLDEYAMDYYEEQRMALENLRYVAIDFTHPSQVMRNIRWYASQRINAVVGTEGVDARETLRLVNKSGIGLIYCSNFSEMAHLNNNISGAVNEVFLAAEFIKNHRGFYNYDEFKKFSQVIAHYSVASKIK